MEKMEFLVSFLATVLARENAKTTALVLTSLDPSLSSRVFEELPEPRQIEIFAHIAEGDFEGNLPQDIKTLTVDSILRGLGGPRTAANILNGTPPETERRILVSLDKQNRELAETVRHQMFTFDDIVRLSDNEIQEVLREVDTHDLAIALRGAKEETCNRIFANLSERVGLVVKGYVAHDPLTEPSMIEEIQRNIVCTVRQIQQAPFTVDRADHNLPV